MTRLLGEPAIAIVAWIHILAFDQLVGLYIYRDNMTNRYVRLPVQSVLLLLTFMLGPVGLLGYFGLRALRQMQARRNADPGPGLFQGEGAHVSLGVVGLLAAAFCVAALYVNGGAAIGPDGDLMKPLRFNFTVALMSFTLAYVLPLAGFSKAGLRRWRRTNAVITLYSYFAETYMTLQGLDPRFPGTAANATEAIISALLGLLGGLGWLVLYVILLWQVFRRGSAKRSLMTLALRYGMASVMLATAGGLWMVAMQDHMTASGGDTLWLHAFGFHGLQTVPLVGWLLERSGMSEASARRWMHAAGIGWLAATAFVGAHAALGFTLSAYSPALAATAVALLSWGYALLNAANPGQKQAA